jgi:hypothetical protein
MGHVNVLADRHPQLLAALDRLHEAIYGTANAQLGAGDDDNTSTSARSANGQ